MDRALTPVLIDGAGLLRNGEVRTAAVLVRGGQVAAVAEDAAERAHLRLHAAEVVEAVGFWLLPGLVDAHAHAYAGILRGTENGLPLERWALYTVLYGKALDEKALRAAILVGAAERLRNGVSAVLDHSPQVHLAESALAAHEATGLRVGYAPFLHDLNDYALMGLDLPDALGAYRGPPPFDAAASESRFAAVVAACRAGSGRVRPLLGPNAPQRCSPQAWPVWRRLRDRLPVPVHTHLLETRAQARLGHGRWPGGTVGEMERQGLLDEGLSVAHGIWLDEREQDTLARHDVTVVHNPASNLMLGSGLLPFARYRALGVRLALGTDSANTGGRADMWEAMRLALMLHRAPGTDPATWPTGIGAVDMATTNGAHVLGWDDAGRIEPGSRADLVLVRRATAATSLLAETADGIVLHAGAEAVDSVMVDGAWAMRGGQILAFDEAEAAALAVDAHDEIRDRVAHGRDGIHAALPALATALRRFTDP